MILLITYDLRNPSKDYTSLYNGIKSTGTWWHHIDSTWLIETSEGPDYWWRRLREHIDEQNDSMFIVEIKPNYKGWLPEKAWDWIRNRFIKSP